MADQKGELGVSSEIKTFVGGLSVPLKPMEAGHSDSEKPSLHTFKAPAPRTSILGAAFLVM